MTISSESDLENFIYEQKSYQSIDCYDYEFPKINFSNSVLMGFRIDCGGCQPPIITRKVQVIQDSIHLNILVNQVGLCLLMQYDHYWVILEDVIDPDLIAPKIIVR